MTDLRFRCMTSNPTARLVATRGAATDAGRSLAHPIARRACPLGAIRLTVRKRCQRSVYHDRFLRPPRCLRLGSGGRFVRTAPVEQLGGPVWGSRCGLIPDWRSRQASGACCARGLLGHEGDAMIPGGILVGRWLATRLRKCEIDRAPLGCDVCVGPRWRRPCVGTQVRPG